MGQPKIQVLHLEDDPADAELMWLTLKHEGIDFDAVRVDTREDFVAGLNSGAYDLILADYSLPTFDGLTALILTLETSPELPFILVSGELGEDLAIEAMKAGATDYVLKSNLSRLAPSVRRAIREAESVKEKKQAVAESIESEQRYRHLFDSTIDSVMLINPETGAILDVNEASLKTYGYDRAEFLDLNIVDISAEPHATSSTLESIADLGVTRIPERIHKKKDGALFPVEINASIFEFRGKPVVGSFLKDISERKRAQEEANLLVTAVEQSPEAVVITDLAGNIRYVNSAFEHFSGYSRFEVLGKNPRFLKSGVHEEEFYRDLWRTLLSGNRWSGTFVNRKKDGTHYTEEAMITPVEDENGKVTAYVAVKRDVTEELKREEDLRRAQRLEALGQLAGGIAHDFNNLLMVISGSADMLRVKKKNQDIEFEEIETIHATVRRGAELTRRLLAIARQQVLQIEAISANDLINNEIAILRRVIPENIEISCVPASDDLVMRADAGQVGQVMMNLVVNARDAMPEGGLIKISIDRIELEENDVVDQEHVDAGRYVQISIADNGEGMDGKLLKKVFEPFFTTKADGKGTGMGLATVYGIVKQHRGFVDVTSEVGIGTTFDVHFPQSDEIVIPGVNETREDTKKGGETILVVEDDPGVRWAVKSILKSLGYKVIQAENGQEALEELMKNSDEIDLVMSDVVMPKMSGPELFAAARDEGCEATFLFSSGYANQDTWTELVDQHGAHFIAKPFGMEDLATKVREVLDG